MLGLPQSTEVKRPLPKTSLYKQLDWKPQQRESFDSDVSRLDFVNWITPRTLPAILFGNEVKEIFVVKVLLKSRDFDIKSITLLAKSIPQHIVYLLRYDNDIRLAVYHSKLFCSIWQDVDAATLPLNGLNLDSVWENIVSTIGDFSVELDKSLTEQIKIDEERDKLLRQIEALERHMKATKQPRRKREIFKQIQQLKQLDNNDC